jgi:large subunit ribosomal protein L31e
MAEEYKETKVEKETKETKKLDDVKNTEENKKAIAELEEKKVESKPAIEKATKTKEKEAVVELEREYIIPLRKGFLNVPQYRRAKKAVRILKEFLAQHMRVENRDLRKIKLDMYLNNEIWFKGIKKPLSKVKVKAVKKDGIVYAELAELPEVVKFLKARADKLSAAAIATKVKTPKHPKEKTADDVDQEGVADKTEEKEDAKAGAEKAAKTEKAAVKTEKHTAKGSHAKKTMPVRKVLK